MKAGLVVLDNHLDVTSAMRLSLEDFSPEEAAVGLNPFFLESSFVFFLSVSDMSPSSHA